MACGVVLAVLVGVAVYAAKKTGDYHDQAEAHAFERQLAHRDRQRAADRDGQ